MEAGRSVWGLHRLKTACTPSSYPIGLEMNCKDILKNMILEAERQFCTFLFLLNRKLE